MAFTDTESSLLKREHLDASVEFQYVEFSGEVSIVFLPLTNENEDDFEDNNEKLLDFSLVKNPDENLW